MISVYTEEIAANEAYSSPTQALTSAYWHNLKSILKKNFDKKFFPYNKST
jgi:hypothetical protein